MSFLEHCTALFAPDDCLGCGREGSLLCVACRPKLPNLPDRCFSCHKPRQGVACDTCLGKTGLDDIRAIAGYGGLSQALVSQLKFSGNQSAARIIADMAPVLTRPAIIVHMPATTAHIRQRGYDQAELIARRLARRQGLPRLDALRRTGRQHQLGADRQQRLTQMTAALSLRRSVKDLNIMIIDDVLTTGSSLMAAAKVFRDGGANGVSALVFAQALRIEQ